MKKHRRKEGISQNKRKVQEVLGRTNGERPLHCEQMTEALSFTTL
jgi:hypothetical protein